MSAKWCLIRVATHGSEPIGRWQTRTGNPLLRKQYLIQIAFGFQCKKFTQGNEWNSLNNLKISKRKYLLLNSVWMPRVSWRFLRREKTIRANVGMYVCKTCLPKQNFEILRVRPHTRGTPRQGEGKFPELAWNGKCLIWQKFSENICYRKITWPYFLLCLSVSTRLDIKKSHNDCAKQLRPFASLQ